MIVSISLSAPEGPSHEGKLRAAARPGGRETGNGAYGTSVPCALFFFARKNGGAGPAFPLQRPGQGGKAGTGGPDLCRRQRPGARNNKNIPESAQKTYR